MIAHAASSPIVVDLVRKLRMRVKHSPGAGWSAVVPSRRVAVIGRASLLEAVLETLWIATRAGART